jgi:signal transduction histidine kinase
MNEITKYIFFFLIGTTVLNFILSVLARIKIKDKKINYLIYYWLAVSLTYFAVATLSKTPAQIAFAYYFQFISSSLMAKLLMDSRDIKFNLKLYIPLQLVGYIVSTYLLLQTDAGFTLSLLPVTFTTALPLVHPTWNTLVTHRNESNWIEKSMAVIFITGIINHFNYAFFRLDPNAAWWGWSVSVAQYQCLSIFLPFLMNYKRNYEERKNIEMLLERLSTKKKSGDQDMNQLYKKLEEEIDIKQELNDRLEEEREMNVILIKTISHDLANPMTVIKSYLEMINSGRIPQKDIPQILERIKDSTKSALSMIQRIRNAIITRNQSSLTTIQDVDVDYSIKNLLSMFETHLQNKNIKVIYENMLPPNILVAADSNTLTEHVFANVMSNAIKFSYPDSMIRVLVTHSDRHVFIEFVDQGMGFNQLRTEKGYIYPNEGTVGELGSGLGLILMSYFIRKFEGSYAITSEGKGKGTKVVIQLKIAK